MEIDPRVDVVLVDELDETTALPPADVRIATYWRTSEILGARPPDGSVTIQLMQAYETWAGPEERVNATWRLPFETAVVSRSLRSKGLELGVPSERLHLVPNGLDHSMFRATSPVRGRAPCVVFLAHEAAVKGLRDTVTTVELVHRARPNVEFIAFGAMPRPTLIPHYVKYFRHPVGQQLVNHVYNRASIFLCASLSEGWGFPSMEAMACGAALVSTRNGGVDDFANHEESALLSAVGDVRSLANSVLLLLDEDSRRCEIAERGMVRVNSFSWQASAEAFYGVIGAALRHREAG